ncbi:hypothetical protein LOD99_3540 [Oopsacas minuta]|uniref:Single-stranded DNA-binding protein n=1 Tax=Oopsacas minuta TaxID=111878 RepID=A0AAV7JYP0_9METZ|nr:hypothetical protein LOD99_3540 [Oopsacas minuta]
MSTLFKDPIETIVKTPPEVTSLNYILISGRVSRAPEWYEEDGKTLLALGVRTTYSRMKKEIITENGIVKWCQYFIMGQLHRCVCGYKLFGEKQLDLKYISNTINKGDKVIVKGSLRYKKMIDRVCNDKIIGVDILVSSLIVIERGDGDFGDGILHTEAGSKINIGKLNKGILTSEIFEYKG